MAYYVVLWKETENHRHVIYRFGPKEETVGRLRLDKITGEIEELEPAPIKDHVNVYLRARARVYINWKAGEIPDETFWAS